MAGRLDDLVGMAKSPKDFQYHFQRLIQGVATRRRIAQMVAARLPKPAAGPDDARASEAVATLRDDGISFLPPLLDASQLEDIRQYALRHKCHDRTRPENGEFDIEQPHPLCHTAVYTDAATLACPHVLDTVNHPLVLQAVGELFGCKPTISNISMWWSLPGHAKAEHAELFHRDVDDWLFIKLFIYITDVDAGSGPHVFVRGSQNSPKLAKIARYTDEQVAQEFGKDNVLSLTAQAGTSFLENTYGMHKGQLPLASRRLLLQAQYSLRPISIQQYTPRKSGAKTSLDPYVNRLYVA
jgi:hypothetical protein